MTDDVGTVARRQLENVILPFWLSRGIDRRNGGFFTCFDNRGRRLRSPQKFTWSQGRFVWLLARAAGLVAGGLLDLDRDELLVSACRGAQFLVDHAMTPDGTCAYVLDEDGAPVPGPGPAETRSVYADCFVAMGLVELARQSGDRSWLEAADPVVERATHDIEAGSAPTAPYQVPSTYRAFGPRMILLNLRLEQVKALRHLAADDGLATTALGRARTAVLAHRAPDGTFVEMIPQPAGGSGSDRSLLASHRTPGHALEGVWMALEAADLLGVDPELDRVVASTAALCRSGWDAEHGGLFRYVAAAGASEPVGPHVGTEYETLIANTWSTKLWWVHTEAAYTTALVSQRSRDRGIADWFDRIWGYTLSTFPAGADGNEWIQIRDRLGRPLDEVVALPVKDPYHISRNLMQIIELFTQEGTTHT